MSDLILTHSLLTSSLDYDPNTGVLTRKKAECNRIKVGDEAGSMNGNKYKTISLLNKRYQAHRLAWFHFHGSWPLGQIDHRDRDRTNNRIANLRDVGVIENSHNHSKLKTNWSGFTGVSWHKKNCCWVAGIRSNGKKHHLGSFKTKELAAAAYQAAKLIHHPTAPDQTSCPS
jgi:hypothetical protein